MNLNGRTFSGEPFGYLTIYKVYMILTQKFHYQRSIPKNTYLCVLRHIYKDVNCCIVYNSEKIEKNQRFK